MLAYPENMDAKLLTDSEAAELLALTSRQVVRLARCGELPMVVLPGNEIRFDADDIRQWIETRKRLPTRKQGEAAR